jgi:hypothetical protein
MNQLTQADSNPSAIDRRQNKLRSFFRETHGQTAAEKALAVLVALGLILFVMRIIIRGSGVAADRAAQTLAQQGNGTIHGGGDGTTYGGGDGYYGGGYYGGSGYYPHGSSTPGSSSGDGPIEGPVSEKEIYDRVDYDRDGDSEWWNAAQSPVNTIRVKLAEGDAFDTTEAEYPDQPQHNNEADAFRHAYFNYILTQRIGANEAKSYADAHERSGENPKGEELMDLFNNDVGRRLALDPSNKGRDPVEVIHEAIRNGQLQTKPFEIK